MSEALLPHELRLYWRTVSEAKRIRRANPDGQTTEQESDLEMIVIHSDSPRMRALASAELEQLRQVQPAVAEALS